MTPQEDRTAAAERLADALTAAAAIMPPDETQALASPVPAQLASPSPGPARRGIGHLRGWLIPPASRPVSSRSS